MRYLLCVLICLFIGGHVMADEIRVAAAISMKEALTDAAREFTAQTNNTVQFAFGASGELETQVKNSGNVDVFISAAAKQMDDLQEAKLIDAESRRVVAKNELVLVVPADAKNVPTDFGQLKDAAYKKIAVGEPKSVPAGDYAEKLLTTLKLMEAVKGRLVYGANVRQVLVFVERGEVDAGIVYATDAAQAGEHVKVAAKADPADHPPIEYPAAAIAGSTHAATAAKFLAFLSSHMGEKILVAHGFLPVGEPAENRQQ
jgi:molybdate transport system substrate-binding protein